MFNKYIAQQFDINITFNNVTKIQKVVIHLTYLPSIQLQIHLRNIKTRLFNSILEEQMSKVDAERKAMIGRGDRSEKIRTYNYPQNRVSDHRIGLTLQRLDAIMEGRLDLVLEPLLNEFQKRQLMGETV